MRERKSGEEGGGCGQVDGGKAGGGFLSAEFAVKCHQLRCGACAAPGSGALDAVRYAVKYCATNGTLCLFQPYGSDGLWPHYSDSGQSSNAKPQNKRRSWLAGMSVRGRAPIDWSRTATSV